VVSAVATTVFWWVAGSVPERVLAVVPGPDSRVDLVHVKTFVFLYVFLWVRGRCRATATTADAPGLEVVDSRSPS